MNYIQQLQFFLLRESMTINISPSSKDALSFWFHCHSNIGIFVEMHENRREKKQPKSILFAVDVF